MTSTIRIYIMVGLVAMFFGIVVGYFVWGDPIVVPVPPAPLPPSCNTCYPSDCTIPFDGIDARLAEKMVVNYHNNHLNVLNQYCNTVNGQDSRSVWFSLEKVKRFIYQIESKACNMCTTDPRPKLGIRIYFAEYPTVPAEAPGIETSYLGLHTLLMVPTYDDGTVDRDFDPAYINAGCRPAPMDSVGAVLTALPPDPENSGQSNANMRNHGYLFPPPYLNGNCPLNKSQYFGADYMFYVDNLICP